MAIGHKACGYQGGLAVGLALPGISKPATRPAIGLPLLRLRTRSCRSAEREHKSLHAGIEEFDLELTILNRRPLPDHLIQPLFHDPPIPAFVDIVAAIGARRLFVDEYPETNRRPWRRRPHDEVKVPRMEAKRDPAIGRVQRGKPLLHRPITGKSPLVETQPRRGGIDVALVP